MHFQPNPVLGCYTIALDMRGDDRGFFARFYCENEFAQHGLQTHFVQINTSLSVRRGTLRGMHYQLAPAAEAKVVRCLSGALYDVVLDLRPDSPTKGKWFAAELNAENRLMMYVPKGCAHGFLTLHENTEALYLVSAFYAPDKERGVRFNDPRFAIEWPYDPVEISNKDRNWPDYEPRLHGEEQLAGLV